MPVLSQGAQFDSTRWSVVLEAARKSEPQQIRAMEQLCQIYWFPLYAFIRKQGFSPADAEDHTQTFFQKLISGSMLEVVSPERGKFRSYLLACCKNFLINVYNRDQAIKRGGGSLSFSIDALEAEDRFHAEITDHATPEKAYDKGWALALIEHVVKNLETEYREAGKEQHFFLLRPLITMEGSEVSYLDMAEELHTTEANIQIMVFRLRRKFGEKLRHELRATVEEPSEVEDELRYLISAASR